jgi:hypothetical protein
LCSGVCVDRNGLILTARHCGFGKSVTVEFPDGRREVARKVFTGGGLFDGVMAFDLPGDNWPFYEVSPVKPRPGDTVWLAGYPLGKYQSWKTTVVRETIIPPFEKYTAVNLETDVGWSGGPLINTTGRLIGLLSHKDVLGERLSYCIDQERIVKAYNQLCDEGYCDRARQRPGTAAESPPGDDSQAAKALIEPPSEPDWSHLLAVLQVPEILEGTKGTLAGLGQRTAVDLVEDTVNDITQGKVSVEIVFQRIEPMRFMRVSDATRLPELGLTLLIKRQSVRITRGLLLKLLEKRLPDRLQNIPVEIVFERERTEDYAEILAAVQAPEPIPDVEEDWPPDEQSPPVEESKIKQWIKEGIKTHAPKPVIQKVEKLNDAREAYRDGGIGSVLVLLIGGYVRRWWIARKAQTLVANRKTT